MHESRRRPAPWLIKALNKRAQEKVEQEKDGQLFENPEQLEKEPQECGT